MKDLQKSVEVFDDFMNLAIDRLGGEGLNIVELMTSYNNIKNALATISEDEE